MDVHLQIWTDRVDASEYTDIRYHSLEPLECRARAKKPKLYVPLAAHLFAIFRSAAS
jgi:hypothetical protein